MSDTTATTETASTEGESTTENKPVEKTPEWYEGELKRVRGEAAKNRVEKKDAVEKAKADTAAEFQAKLDEATVERDQAKSQLAKLTAAMSVDIPREHIQEFAARLQGETEEELAQDAERLSGLFGGSGSTTRSPAVDPSAARQTKHMALNGDPLLDAIKAKLNI